MRIIFTLPNKYIIRSPTREEEPEYVGKGGKVLVEPSFFVGKAARKMKEPEKAARNRRHLERLPEIPVFEGCQEIDCHKKLFLNNRCDKTKTCIA